MILASAAGGAGEVVSMIMRLASIIINLVDAWCVILRAFAFSFTENWVIIDSCQVLNDGFILTPV